MYSIISQFIRSMILGVIGGLVYLMIEILYRGYTHWTMFFVGGLCFIVVGLINEFFCEDMYMELQAICGAIMVTATEFVSGIYINLIKGWNVWDYSNQPFNVMGQICIPFFGYWILLAIVAIYVDDKLRTFLFHEPKVKYRWFILKWK